MKAIVDTGPAAEIETVESLSPAAFVEQYVSRGRPVLMKGAVRFWKAVRRWEPAYFSDVAGGLSVTVKTGNVARGDTTTLPLGEYVSGLYEYERILRRGKAVPGSYPYLHDIPVFHLIPELVADVSPFPSEWVPRWYRKNVLAFAQFFMSATGSKTPLHFDTLLTHNLFFQVHGEKRFILISPGQIEHCYMRSWRWSEVDAANPDLDRFPRFARATPVSITVGPGDMLFMPSGALHEVVTLNPSVSFNVDWHTRNTAIRGVMSGLKGAPLQNVYYNALIALGVGLGVPERLIFPFYRSYLNYIS